MLAGNTNELTIEINELIALKNAFTARSRPPDPRLLIQEDCLLAGFEIVFIHDEIIFGNTAHYI